MRVGFFCVVFTIIIFVAMTPEAYTYEKAFDKTPVGVIEVKKLPPSHTLVASSDGDYFDRSDELFMRLFKYIDRNKIEMTIPVQADVAETRMRFFVGAKDLEKLIQNEMDVRSMELPERTVARIGARGAYSEKNFHKARSNIEKWIQDRPEYEPAGEAYAVYWNGPFVLWFLKRFEVHIPIRSK